jgi:hypothetical protein
MFGEKVLGGTFHTSCHIQYSTMKCHQLFGCDVFPPDSNLTFLQRHGVIYFFTYISISAAISLNTVALKNGETGICHFQSGL